MNDRLRRKISGLRTDMHRFAGELCNSYSGPLQLAQFSNRVIQEMKQLDYDFVDVDEMKNTIGIIKGYKNEGSMIILNPIELSSNTDTEYLNDAQIGQNTLLSTITSVYAGALLKRSISALTGDLIVCCVPREQCNSARIQYLFQTYLKNRDIKGVLLAAPTNFNLHIGNRGRMEYEIVVKGDLNDTVFSETDTNILNTMYPLVKELEDLSQHLPKNYELGDSELKIKDISYYTGKVKNEYHVLVDRIFTPEETSTLILERAQNITNHLLKDKQHAITSTAITESKLTTKASEYLNLKNHYKPWKIGSHTPFVYSSWNVLKENNINAEIGYWKKIITEGSYTCGELKIPTLGFGAGTEDSPLFLDKNICLEDLEKSIYGKALIVYRNIGYPTFGWCDDEI